MARQAERVLGDAERLCERQAGMIVMWRLLARVPDIISMSRRRMTANFSVAVRFQQRGIGEHALVAQTCQIESAILSEVD